MWGEAKSTLCSPGHRDSHPRVPVLTGPGGFQLHLHTSGGRGLTASLGSSPGRKAWDLGESELNLSRCSAQSWALGATQNKLFLNRLPCLLPVPIQCTPPAHVLVTVGRLPLSGTYTVSHHVGSNQAPVSQRSRRSLLSPTWMESYDPATSV